MQTKYIIIDIIVKKEKMELVSGREFIDDIILGIYD